jgi:hypothetical protein
MTTGYKIFDPKVDKPLHELSRVEANSAYRWFISQKDKRKTMLMDHAKRNGFPIEGDAKELIENLHEFFVTEVKKEKKGHPPSSYIFSLCNDIGMLISDLLIEKAPQLSWTMHTAGKTDLSFQRPVIIGFNVKNKNYSVDIDYLLCQYAHRLASTGVKEDSFFWNIYSAALAKALIIQEGQEGSKMGNSRMT